MRSALFVPADSERKLAKALGGEADALFIDLEDSVALDRKPAAREMLGEFLSNTTDRDGPALYVRINALDLEMFEEDLPAAVKVGVTGIVLPKSQHGQDVTKLDALLRVHEAYAGLPDGGLRIVAIATETALGTLQAGTYPGASERLAALSWGAEDLSADVGALEKRYPDGRYRDTFRFARTQCLLGAVAAATQPLDTVYPDFRDTKGFEAECRDAAIDGFTGKMAIHPDQVGIINAVFTPSPEQVERAQAIVSAFEEAGEGAGVVSLDGSMLDRPHLRAAQALLARAK